MATARKLAERVYRLLRYGEAYVRQDVEAYEAAPGAGGQGADPASARVGVSVGADGTGRGVRAAVTEVASRGPVDTTRPLRGPRA